MSIASPTKWHGGKAYLAARIVALMPPRCKNPNNPDKDDPGWLHYCEPYFGGGSVLFENDPIGISEAVNDLNGPLTNFWRVLSSPIAFGQFARMVDATPFSEWCWDNIDRESFELYDGEFGQDSTEAYRFFVRCRLSMAGRMKDFAPLSRTRTRRGMNEQASAWLTTIEGLPEVHERLKRL